MDYFELFKIEVDLFPDEAELKSNFYALSRKYHPDINQVSDPEAYMEIMEMSGRVNTAYKTLANLDSRLKYILDLHQQLEDKNEALPDDFLMEMMELNEEMMEAAMNDDKKAAMVKQLDDREEKTLNVLKTTWSQRNTTELDMSTLEKLKSSYYQRKYLLRIRKNLNSFADA
jgi:molecular chaperone HscB